MSVKVMTLVWENFNRGGSEKLVMLAMADWCNDAGSSLHPSHDAVAKKCCISRSQAVRVIRDLCQKGYLEVVGNQFGGAPGTTKQYRINLDMLTGSADATPTDSTSATGSVDATGSTHAQRRVAPMRETGSTHATQTTIEPSIEPSIINTRASKNNLFANIPDDLVADYLSVRKAKKAGVMTKTAFDGLKREASIAGLTIEQALTICCERNWVGFKADWISQEPVIRTSRRDLQNAAVANSIFGSSKLITEKDITNETAIAD